MNTISKVAISVFIVAGVGIGMTNLAHSNTDRFAAKYNIQKDITAEESAENSGDAKGATLYDAPNFKEWDKFGKLDTIGKAADLKQVKANIAGCDSIDLHGTITTFSLTGNTATIVVTREGTLVVGPEGKTKTLAYNATEKEIWIQTSSGGWLETEGHGLTLSVAPVKN